MLCIADLNFCIRSSQGSWVSQSRLQHGLGSGPAPITQDPASPVWYVTGDASVGRAAKGIAVKQPDIIVNDVSVSKVHVSLSVAVQDGPHPCLQVKGHQAWAGLLLAILKGLPIVSPSWYVTCFPWSSGSRGFRSAAASPRGPAACQTVHHTPHQSTSPCLPPPAMGGLSHRCPLPQASHGISGGLSWLARTVLHCTGSGSSGAAAGSARAKRPKPSDPPQTRDPVGSPPEQSQPQPQPQPQQPSQAAVPAAGAAAAAQSQEATGTEAFASCIQILGGAVRGYKETGQPHTHAPGAVVVCEACARAPGTITPHQLLVAVATCDWASLRGVSTEAAKVVADMDAAAAAKAAAAEATAAAAAAAAAAQMHTEDLTEEEEEEEFRGDHASEVVAGVGRAAVALPFSAAASTRDRHPASAAVPLKRSAAAAVEEAVDGPGSKRRRADAASAAAAGPAPSGPVPACPSMIPSSTCNQSSVTHNTAAAPVVPVPDPSVPGRATKAWRLANGTLSQGKRHTHGSPQVDVAVSSEQAQHQQQHQQQQQQQRQLQAQEQKRKLDFSTVRATPTASAAQSVQQLGVCHEITTMPLVVHRTLGQSPPRAGHHSAGNGSAAGEVDFKAFRKASAATPKPAPIRLTTEDQFRAHADNDAYGREEEARKKRRKQADNLFQTAHGTAKRQR
ncbi:MAG: hypothetical protein WDW38_008667 [Sanguina aurantia]